MASTDATERTEAAWMSSSDVEGVCPLSALQQGILLHHLVDPVRDGYVLSVLFELSSHHLVEPFLNALQGTIKRHQALRSAVRWEGLPSPLQVIYRSATLPVQEIELTQDRPVSHQLKALMRPDSRTFDLQQAPLAHLLIANSPGHPPHYAILRAHHIICDYQSLKTIVSEAMAVVGGRAKSRPQPQPLPPIFAETHSGPSTATQEAFFADRLGDFQEPSASFGLIEIRSDSHPVVEHREELSGELSQRIRSEAGRFGVTPARVFHAACALVTAHTSGRDDVVFGTVISTDRGNDGQRLGRVALSVNTLPIRLRLREKTALDLLGQTQRELEDLLKYRESPLTLAQRCSGLGGAIPLFSTLFNFRRAARTGDPEWPQAVGVRVLRMGEAWTGYPITLIADDLGSTFRLTVQTDHRIDGSRFLAYVCTALGSLVEALAEDPKRPALALTILPEVERRQLLSAFGSPRTDYPQDELIHGIFEEQVARQPDAIAVVFNGESATYADLNRKANQLARYLTKRGIGPDRLVGICMERSLEMITGLLGILKSGGAYVPLDPALPPERLSYLLADAAPTLLLTQERLKPHLPSSAAEVISVDTDWSRIALEDSDNPDGRSLGLHSAHLSYVIYTSGSTGRPKGVMIEHRNVTRLFAATQKWFHFDERDVWTLFHSFAFDFSVWEIWGALLHGGRLVVVPHLTTRAPQDFYRLLCEHRVTVLNQTPSAFAQLIDAQSRAADLQHCLRVVIFGGEALELRSLRPWVRRNGAAGPSLVNMYGITETTVHVTYCPLSDQEIESERGNLIGRSIPDLRLYLLDDRGQPVPIGAVGEIHVGGAGVARGYLNRPELTQERFIPDPFRADSDARLYKSGDLGRWRPDGTLEYLGRNDHQVKIRGFRIELGEIETQLAQHPQVRDVAVLAREDVPGEKRLIAYVIPTDPAAAELTLGSESIRAHLKSRLPDYMVPSAFVIMDRFPLTPNGKLDRHALPPAAQQAYINRHYEPPRGELEEILAGIWQSLLQVQHVGRHHNFFELGGHSLLIMQMLERLRRVGLSAAVRHFYENPTLADLARVLTTDTVGQVEIPPNRIPDACEHITPQMLSLVELEPEQIEQIVTTVPGGAVNIQDIYPLAPLQEGLLFHHILNPQRGDTYVVPTLLRVCSRERLEELIGALQAVVDRHDVLRTAILWESLPHAVQVVYRKAPLLVEERSLDPHRDTKEQLDEWIHPGRLRMDLRRAPLIQLEVAADPHGAGSYTLIKLHHIVGDNTSMEIVGAELAALLERRSETFAESVPYRNHVAQALAYTKAGAAEAFFRSKLADIDEPTAPFRLLDVHGDGTHVEEAREDLEPMFAKRIRQQALRLGISAAAVFHTAWALVIARTSARSDVVFGTVLLGRLQGGLGSQQSLGMFINTLPLRLTLRDTSAQEALERTQRELVQLLSHEQAPLALAQRCSGIDGAAPIFTALLNYRHGIPSVDAQWAQVSGIEVLARSERTNYPLVLSVNDLPENFQLIAQTDPRIDPHRILGYMRTVLLSLTQALESAPLTPALTLEILPEEERRRVIELFNDTRADYPRTVAIHTLLERQAERTPAATVSFDGRSLTYAELNARANQLAWHLKEQGVQRGEFIPILMSRSFENLIAQLAVLKSGGAYVPIDPEFPPTRQAFMIRDSGARRVLTAQDSPLERDFPALQWLNVSAASAEIARHPTENLQLDAGGHDAAYVMYTSGSTGNPKGVIVLHHAVNRLAVNNGFAGIDSSDCLVHYSNPAFDASTFEIWSALLNGARLLILPQAVVLDSQKFSTVLREHGVTILWLPVGLFNQYSTILTGVLPTLRYVFVGGDTLDPKAVRWVLHNGPPECLYNAYGPTEGTTFTTMHRIERVEVDATHIPIGRPMSNAQIYLLNEQRQPVPIGVPGEIYIGGAGIARGYLNQDELTTERFLSDPFSPDPQARMYKTGDLGCWRPEGTVEFLGRNDHQVKIRGFRVELGEIEAQLARHPEVHQAVVLAREDLPGDKRLVAYLVAKDAGHPPAVDSLRALLKAALPEYMVPGAFVALSHLPLTTNGKLDRRALPAPEPGAHGARAYEPPRGQAEEILAGIWKHLLNVPQVGRQDNFFELGGHSLLIVQALDRLRRAGFNAEVRRFFDTPTLADLAMTLSSASEGLAEAPSSRIPQDCNVITPDMLPLVELNTRHIDTIVSAIAGGAANVEDIYPLAPLQEGILFHHLLSTNGEDTYIISILLSVAPEVSPERLVAAFQGVIDRNDVLRTAVLWEDLPQPVQVVQRKATLPVTRIALTDGRDPVEQLKERMKLGRHAMDVRQAPLLRLQVATASQGAPWYVLLQFHHLVCDHESLDILLEEVTAHLQSRTDTLSTPIPYRNHVAQVLASRGGGETEAFFRGRLSDVDEPTAPFGLLDVHGDGRHVERVTRALDPTQSERVRTLARRFGASPATVFHAAWSLVVAHTSAREDVVFGTVLLGRLRNSAGAQRIPGMFINTLPLRVRLGDIDARELLKQTQRELGELLNHEQASLAVAQRCSRIAGSAPLFTAVLNYRHSATGAASRLADSAGVAMIGAWSRSNYPLLLSIDDQGTAFSLDMATDGRIDPDRMLGYTQTALHSLLDALESAPHTAALALPILPGGERDQLIRTFNETEAEYPEEALINELFEEQVEQTPHQPAVMFETDSLSYAELNARANQVARHLRAHGVGPDRLVAVCLERSLDLLVAILGVLKAGGAYVPLDPSIPRERLQYILADAAPELVLTHEKVRSQLPSSAANVIALDSAWPGIAGQDSGNLRPRPPGLTCRSLAYVIYTSGSTGRPKGVMVEHRNVVNYAVHAVRQFDVRNGDGTVICTSVSFDLMLTGLYPTLLAGKPVRLCPEVQGLPELAQEVLKTNNLAPLKLTPSHLSLLENPLREGQLAGRVRVLVLGGEPLHAPALEPWRTYAPGTRLFNHYGPTEATIGCVVHEVGTEISGAIPIGRPISNVRIYILNNRMQPVPIGVPGEIYIGGAGIARGYLNKPDLTAERFVLDPFSPDPQARLYRSGDLAQWQPDGTIRYLGRNDGQIKLRGYRIELGEIQMHLVRHPHVRHAAVITREDVPGQIRLVAYVVPEEKTLLDLDALRAHLKTTLPDYMIPSAFVSLERLPVTANGKLDKRALPVPEYGSQHYEPPQGPIESVVAEIWQELLHVDRVGRHDNFFELGGHSLMATQLMVRIRSALSIEMPMRMLFESATPKDLTVRLNALRDEHLLRVVAQGGRNLEELLARVASMDEGEVQEQMMELANGGRR